MRRPPCEPSAEHAHRLTELKNEAEKELEGENGAATEQMAPWERLIYEVAKLACTRTLR